MDTQKTGEFLRALRKAKGLTQEEVAEQLFLSPKTVSRWESGAGLPDINIISGVAALYGVTVDEILQGEKKTDRSENLTEQTKRLKNDGRARIIRENLLKKYNVFFIVAVSVLGFFLLLEILLGFLVNQFVALVLMAARHGRGTARRSVRKFRNQTDLFGKRRRRSRGGHRKSQKDDSEKKSPVRRYFRGRSVPLPRPRRHHVSRKRRRYPLLPSLLRNVYLLRLSRLSFGRLSDSPLLFLEIQDTGKPKPLFPKTLCDGARPVRLFRPFRRDGPRFRF